MVPCGTWTRSGDWFSVLRRARLGVARERPPGRLRNSREGGGREDSGVAIFEEYLVAADGVGAVVDGDGSGHASVLRTVRPSPLPSPACGRGQGVELMGWRLVRRRASSERDGEGPEPSPRSEPRPEPAPYVRRGDGLGPAGLAMTDPSPSPLPRERGIAAQ